MATAELEVVVDPHFGHHYVPSLDVTFIREADGKYYVWAGFLETDFLGTPDWLEFASFHGSFDRTPISLVIEHTEREINNFGKWWD